MTTAAELLLLLIIVSVAIVIYFRVIPYAGRLLAVTWMHQVRSRVFWAGHEHADIRSLLLFRDIDHLLAYLLHVVRDRPVTEAFVWFTVLTKDREEKSPRSQLYREEIDRFAKEHPEACEELLGVLTVARRAYLPVLLRVTTAHPALLFGLGPIALFLGGVELLRHFEPERVLVDLLKLMRHTLEPKPQDGLEAIRTVLRRKPVVG